MLGLAPTAELRLAPPPPVLDADGLDADRLTQAALRHRLDLQALREGYLSQESQVRRAVATSIPLPQLNWNRARDTGSIWSRGPGIGFSLPLWNRGRGDIQIATATRSQLAAEYSARVYQTRGVSESENESGFSSVGQAGLPTGVAGVTGSFMTSVGVSMSGAGVVPVLGVAVVTGSSPHGATVPAAATRTASIMASSATGTGHWRLGPQRRDRNRHEVTPAHSSVSRRRRFFSPVLFLAAMRRSTLPREGLVFTRRLGTCWAWMI